MHSSDTKLLATDRGRDEEEENKGMWEMKRQRIWFKYQYIFHIAILIEDASCKYKRLKIQNIRKKMMHLVVQDSILMYFARHTMHTYSSICSIKEKKVQLVYLFVICKLKSL